MSAYPRRNRNTKPKGRDDRTASGRGRWIDDPVLERQLFSSELAKPDDLDPERYPHLDNISAAFMYRFMCRPLEPRPPEYVYVPIPARTGAPGDDLAMRTQAAIAEWNYAWEAAELRSELHADSLPPNLSWLRTHKGQNLCLVGRWGRTRYEAYASLYHLLPRRVLERHGLPLFNRGLWPNSVPHVWRDRMLPVDADARLGRALAGYLWPLLVSGSRLDGFSASDPIHLCSPRPL